MWSFLSKKEETAEEKANRIASEIVFGLQEHTAEMQSLVVANVLANTIAERKSDIEKTEKRLEDLKKELKFLEGL